ncbi:MAG: DUF4401 domain-containing protein [Elusimicrobia bacterium]|nr:DUF4401 domain-containing protein [Elusimicrobiota bacterium]
MTDEEILKYVPEAQKSSAMEIMRGGGTDDIPVIIKIILGIGAFVSSCLFFGAVGGVAFTMREGAAYLVLGIISMGAAVTLKKLVLPYLGPMLKFFFEQCVLVAMLFGRACIITAAADWSFRENGFLILTFLMAIIPYKFFDSFIDRFIAVFLFALCVYAKYYMMFDNRGYQYISFDFIILIFFIISGIIFAARKKFLNPAAWALITSALVPASFALFSAGAGWLGGGVSVQMQTPYTDVIFNWQKILLAAYFGLMFLAYKKFTSGVKNNDYLVFAVLIFALMPFNLPILYGLFFLLLGKFFDDLKVEILGYTTLGGGIIYLYYSLQVSLMTKSLLLMASGLFLFGAQQLARRIYAR